MLGATPVDPKPPPWRLPVCENSLTAMKSGRAVRTNTSWAIRSPGRIVIGRLPGGLRFTLDTEESIRSFSPDWVPPAGGHRVAVAFRCESPEEVDRL